MKIHYAVVSRFQKICCKVIVSPKIIIHTTNNLKSFRANMSYSSIEMRHILYLSLILVLGSCDQMPSNTDSEDYQNYFVTDLTDGPVIYVYQDSVLDGQFEFWAYRELEDRVEACQFWEELPSQRVVYTRSELAYHMTDLSIELNTGNGRDTLQTEILQDDIFAFGRQAPNSVLVHHIKVYETSDSSIYNEITKNRRFAYDDPVTLASGSTDAVVVSITELYEHYDGGFVTVRNTGREVYAKDIGLVHYEKRRGENAITSLWLQDIIKYDEFEEAFGFRPLCF